MCDPAGATILDRRPAFDELIATLNALWRSIHDQDGVGV
jgi:hypothetical protein